MNTVEPKLLTADELASIQRFWSTESDRGSWGKEDVGRLLGHISAFSAAPTVQAAELQAEQPTPKTVGGCNPTTTPADF